MQLHHLNITFDIWDSRICLRPSTSGLGTTIFRSKRPGLTSALSNDSGKFKLIQCHLHVLLILWVTAPTYCINLINKNNTGRSFLRRSKKVPDPPSSHAHKHLLKLTATAREKGNSSFPRNSSCKHSLSGARGTDKQDTFRKLTT
ncbi:hypothetical protein IEQ34_018888 [Dendrobium chrysotoxum]|uniref:Uncharacterized protein n=1 Tax=Dendrobium chrysotoxum TaxID=161865 RepID=A0AAV7FPR1_DENCH|nr:hypothetical protein IEQ34_018888 [Dendrobium chrysotoxum]